MRRAWEARETPSRANGSDWRPYAEAMNPNSRSGPQVDEQWTVSRNFTHHDLFAPSTGVAQPGLPAFAEAKLSKPWRRLTRLPSGGGVGGPMKWVFETYLPAPVAVASAGR